MAQFKTGDVRALCKPILDVYRGRLARGKTGPTVIYVSGVAGGGKSFAAALLMQLLVVALGGNVELVAVIEDDNYLRDEKGIQGWVASFFFKWARGWKLNYDFAQFRQEIFEPASKGHVMRYWLKNWATQERGDIVTVEGAEIVLVVGRFPYEMVKTYAHFKVWVQTPHYKAVWRGINRSLRGDLVGEGEQRKRKRHYVHLLYWFVWWLKDRQYMKDEQPKRADAILDRSRLQAVPAELRVPAET